MIEKFLKNLNLNIIKPVYYILGENIWLKEKCLDKIIEIIKTQKSNCEFYKFNNKNIDIDNVINICESIPMGADFKCIIIKDWELDKLGDKEMKVLIELVSDIASFCCIIFVNINISVLKTKIKKFLDTIKKNGDILEFKNLNPAEIKEYVVFKIKYFGCQISNKDAKNLVEYCNNDLNKISQEIKKLASFYENKKNKEITFDDIKALVTPSLEVRVFDLVKYINLRNKKQTLILLKNLLDSREEPVMILSIMSMNFLDLYRAKVARVNNKKPEDIIEIFDYKNKEFRVTKAFSQSNNYNFEQLKKIINLLIKSDYKLKSSQVDKEMILETTLLKIFSYLEER